MCVCGGVGGCGWGCGRGGEIHLQVPDWAASPLAEEDEAEQPPTKAALIIFIPD